MSRPVQSENVEAVLRFIDAYNRRDVEAMLEDLDPAVEWRPAFPLSLGEATVYRGHEGAREWLRSLYDALDHAHVEYTEIRDLGDDRILGIGRMRTRGKGSGVETESPFASLMETRNGKAVRIWTYLDPEEARAAAGVEEP
jgi:ketosteroid isomerase-like protein